MTPEEYDLLKDKIDLADSINESIANIDKAVNKIDTTEGIRHIELLISKGYLDILPDNFITSLLHSLVVELEKVKRDYERDFSDL